MSESADRINLTNHFLIAMPGLDDGFFAKSVVFLCEHSERGAMGLVINKPAEINVSSLFEKVGLKMGRDDLLSAPVFTGGPVRPECGFVLHDAMSVTADGDGQTAYASTISVNGGGLEVTSSRDVLEVMAAGAGPARTLIALGYSAWDEGQLESELAVNAWLAVAARHDIIFDAPVAERYDQALSLLGVRNLHTLSPQAGHA